RELLLPDVQPLGVGVALANILDRGVRREQVRENGSPTPIAPGDEDRAVHAISIPAARARHAIPAAWCSMPGLSTCASSGGRPFRRAESPAKTTGKACAAPYTPPSHAPERVPRKIAHTSTG